MTISDIIIACLIAIAVFLILQLTKELNKWTKTEWIPRKMVHISISSIIAFSLPFFTSPLGPIYSVLLVGIALLTFVKCGGNLQEFLQVGTRRGESLTDTFMASLLSLVSFGIVFFVFAGEPFVYTTAILFTSWGDGAGEVVGRTLGRHKFYRYNKSKTLEGSSGVLIMSILAIFVSGFLFWIPSTVITGFFFLRAVLVAVGVTITEFLSTKWADNLTIPIIGALMLYIMFITP